MIKFFQNFLIAFWLFFFFMCGDPNPVVQLACIVGSFIAMVELARISTLDGDKKDGKK